MKILIWFFFVFLSCSAPTVKLDDLRDVNGLVYHLDSDIPFTGKAVGRANNRFYNYQNGLLHGESVSYRPDGTVEIRTFYKNGLRDEFFYTQPVENDIYTEGIYKDDHIISSTSYYPGGAVFEENTDTTVGNHKNGKYTRYYENGKVMSVTLYEKVEDMELRYYIMKTAK